MAEDRLDIRVGVSVQGLDASKRQTADLETKARKVKQDVTKADQQASAVQRRVESLLKGQLKQAGRFFLASALTEGFDALIPNQDHNAWARLGTQVGTNVGIGLVSGGPTGAIIGLMVSGIQVLKEGLSALSDEVKQQSEKARVAEKAIQDLFRKLGEADEERRRTFDKRVKDFEDKLYTELRIG
jgi:translation initiation factor 2B subunit (eIF-2B alpha/beta/delta family)